MTDESMSRRNRAKQTKRRAESLPEPRKGWQLDARCVGSVQMTLDVAPDEAREVCEGCPVIRDCALTALADPTPAGVWAGVQMAGMHTQRTLNGLRAVCGLPPAGITADDHEKIVARRADLVKRIGEFKTKREAAQHYGVSDSTIANDLKVMGLDFRRRLSEKCSRGHSRWVMRGGRRQCMECTRIHARERRSRKRVAA